MVHSFLMIGQSNMAGRGFAKDVAPIFDEHIKVLRNGRWHTMTEPINYDRPSSGVSLAASFAAAWRLLHATEDIGLIPCADGGTDLNDWAVGGVLFDHAVFQAKLAQRTSTLSGILWHQGESDCFPDRVDTYAEKFTVIVNALRKELNVPDIPLIIGGLGDFLTEGMYGQYFTLYPQINEALKRFALSTADCYFATASGLTANPDGIHMDAVSQRVFGIRYFEAFHQRRHIFEPLAGEQDVIQLINSRPLTKTELIALLEIRFSTGEISLDAYKTELTVLKQ